MARYDLNYKPWQRKMVDPNHPGGAVKFGVRRASPKGENMLMGGLVGSLLPLLPLRSIPSVFKKQLNPKQLLQQMRTKLGGRDPGMYPPVKPVTTVPHHIRNMLRPQYGGRQRGTWFPDSSGKQVFRPATRTAGDLQEEYLKASARHNRRLTEAFTHDWYRGPPLRFPTR